MEEQDIPDVQQGGAQIQEKRKWVRTWINTPWIFIAAIILVAGVWVVNNTWVITKNLDKPYLLLAFPTVVASCFLSWFLVTSFKAIVAWCRYIWNAFTTWKKQDGSSFWIVIAIFLTVSVLESGTYFNGLLGSNDLYGLLGYASAFVIDLVAVECMRARLGATRMRDSKGMNLYLLGVIACSGMSAFANTYTALMHFTVPANTMLPTWMVLIVPWTGCVFPLLIIFLSFTADYTADQTSTKLDPENYRAQEQKRMALLTIQREMLEERVRLENEIDQLGTTLHSYKDRRVFFLVNLFFPKEKKAINLAFEDRIKSVQEEGVKQQKEVRELLEKVTLSVTGLIQKVDTIEQRNGVAYDALSSHLSEALQSGIQASKDASMVALNEAINDLVIRYDTVISERLQEMTIEMSKVSGYSQNTGTLDARKKEIANPFTEKEMSDLSAYPFFLSAIRAGQRSLTLEEIEKYTFHSRKMILNRIKDGTLKKTVNPGKFTIASIGKWLIDAPLPVRKEVSKTDDTIHDRDDDKVPDTEVNGHHNGNGNRHDTSTIKLDDFVPMEV